jgi:glycosyltransferase involved in cell wall biosynthesis
MEMVKPLITIVAPTLNEESNIRFMLESVAKQTNMDTEIVVVDGGSSDKTVSIAESYSAKVMVEKGLQEFPSRNIGAKAASGEILLFTCADAIFPPDLLERIDDNFRDKQLIALTGPDIPLASSLAKMEYGLYNFLRWIFCILPGHSKRFSTSTNFLAVKKTCFWKTGGFIHDINSDGLMGQKLSELGKVKFVMNTKVFISSRRFQKMGLVKFNLHYLYVLENFFPFLHKNPFIKILKNKSGAVHSNMRLTGFKDISKKS